MTLKTVEWKNNSVVMIDQTKLPNILEYVTYTDFNEVADAIRTLVVRGAPAIGIAAAYGMALAARQLQDRAMPKFLASLEIKAMELASSRPTAVNLRWAIEVCLAVARQCETPEQVRQRLISKAEELHQRDVFFPCFCLVR